jgi:hypothetical protein
VTRTRVARTATGMQLYRIKNLQGGLKQQASDGAKGHRGPWSIPWSIASLWDAQQLMFGKDKKQVEQAKDRGKLERI